MTIRPGHCSPVVVLLPLSAGPRFGRECARSDAQLSYPSNFSPMSTKLIGLAVERTFSPPIGLGPLLKQTRDNSVSRVMRDLHAEGSLADLHMCRWYIDRIRVTLRRPILRFICTAMHHHEAEDFKVPFSCLFEPQKCGSGHTNHPFVSL